MKTIDEFCKLLKAQQQLLIEQGVVIKMLCEIVGIEYEELLKKMRFALQLQHVKNCNPTKDRVYYIVQHDHKTKTIKDELFIVDQCEAHNIMQKFKWKHSATMTCHKLPKEVKDLKLEG